MQMCDMLYILKFLFKNGLQLVRYGYFLSMIYITTKTDYNGKILQNRCQALRCT